MTEETAQLQNKAVQSSRDAYAIHVQPYSGDSDDIPASQQQAQALLGQGAVLPRDANPQLWWHVMIRYGF